jgi:hypothetical protein
MGLLRASKRREADYRTLIWETAVTANPAIHLNWHAPDATPPEPDPRARLPRRAVARDRPRRDQRGDLGRLSRRRCTRPCTPRTGSQRPMTWPPSTPSSIPRSGERAPRRPRAWRAATPRAFGSRCRRKRAVAITVDVPQPDQASHLPTMELVRDYWRAVGIDLNINPVERSAGPVAGDLGAARGHRVVVRPELRHDPVHEPHPDRRVRPLRAAGGPVGVDSGGERGEAPEGDLARVLELWEEIKATRRRRGSAVESVPVDGPDDERERVGARHRGPDARSRSRPSTSFRNIPERGVGWDYVPLTPKNAWPEQFFFEAR